MRQEILQNTLSTLEAYKTGAGSRIRTDDRLITNQVLYQLSYAGVWRTEGVTK